MDGHISRALTVGVAIMLFMLGFTLFLSGYTANERFLDVVMEDKNALDPVLVTDSESYTVSGAEVTCFILEKVRQDEQAMLDTLYQQEQNGGELERPLPDILVDGRSYRDAALSSIHPDDAYHPSYSVDSSGRVIMIEFTER